MLVKQFHVAGFVVFVQNKKKGDGWRKTLRNAACMQHNNMSTRRSHKNSTRVGHMTPFDSQQRTAHFRFACSTWLESPSAARGCQKRTVTWYVLPTQTGDILPILFSFVTISHVVGF